jgi:hypothetical protein
MENIWQWFINFIGVNNGYNDFSTHMYNFWSGFGGNISILALIGAMVGVYRHHLKRLNKLNALNPLNLVHNNPLNNIVNRKDSDQTDKNQTDKK